MNQITKYNSSLRLAYILENFPSPTEYFVLNEIIELEKLGIELCILVVRKQKQYLSIPDLKNLKSRVIYLPKVYRYFPWIVFFRFPRLIFSFHPSCLLSISLNALKKIRNTCISHFFANKLKNERIDHIHAHFAFIATDIALLLAEILGLEYSFTAHAQDIFTNEAKIRKQLKQAAFVVTCTKFNKEYINNLHCTKVYHVYHGIDFKKWLLVKHKNQNRTVFKILSIARIVEKKGLIYLIKAVEILIKQGLVIECTIIGEGPLRNELNAYIKDKQMQNIIKISGFVNKHKIQELLSESDVFVLPCIKAQNGDMDGLPNVIVEAMLSKLPVITTSVSAIPEVVVNMVTGILVKEKDEVSIANAIKLLQEEDEVYTSIVINAKERILKEFDIQLCTRKLVDVFVSNIC